MLFRVTCYTEIELFTRTLYLRTVNKHTVIEIAHLFYKFCSMCMSALCRSENFVLSSLVSTKQKNIAYSKELQVQQLIFDIFFRDSATYNVRYDRNVVFLLNSGSNGYCAGASAYLHPLQETIVQFFIYIFAMVCSYIDKQRVVIPQFINSLEQLFRACAF